MQTAATSSTSRHPPPPMSVSMMSGTRVAARMTVNRIAAIAMLAVAAVTQSVLRRRARAVMGTTPYSRSDLNHGFKACTVPWKAN